MISLAMPTYNGEKYIKEQLDSIYNQTMVPDEVVVVDDCSTDGTVNILEEYKQKYGLKYYVNEKNLGYNKNFEKAIKLCSGDYIALSDQDDVWLPEKIEKSFKKITEFHKDEPSLVSSFGFTTDENLNIVSRNDYKSGDWKLNFTQYASQGCTLMFNKALKNIIIPFPENIMYDAYIGFTASMIGNRYYIGENLMKYRIHFNNSFASSKKKSFIEKFKYSLNSYVPGWFGYKRYKSLLFLLTLNKNNILPQRIEYIEQIIKIYEVNPLKRVLLFFKLKDVSLKRRLKTCFLLFIKSISNAKDLY